MSGRALIFVVMGVIITTSVILYNIGASSSKIAATFDNYFLRQSSQNLAQSGVNLGLRQLANDRTWRTGFSLLPLQGGKVSVRVFDTTYAGITTAIGIQSTGYAEYGTSLQTQSLSTAYAYFPPSYVPGFARGLLTLNGVNQMSNNIVIDGRDHPPDSTTVIAGNGTWGVWSAASSFTQAPNGKVGGTSGSTDYAPSTSPTDTVVIRLNQTFPGGFPTTPDSAFGGPSAGFTEGTLKAIAKTGVAGSQYVTDPSLLSYPLQGVTYIEMPTSSPQNKWSAGTTSLTGTGILIVHNSAHNAIADNVNGSFDGIFIGDDISRLHGNIWGAMMVLTQTPSGNVLGNGGAAIYFSRTAIKNAVGIFTNGSSLKTIAWWE